MVDNKKTLLNSFYEDPSNFEINIDKIYSDFITAIDNVRSYSSTWHIDDGIIKRSLINDGNTFGLKLAAKTESTMQESRCHAFYRMIGFPVVGKDNKYYNPGFDSMKHNPGDGNFTDSSDIRDITQSVKYGIAANPIIGFRLLSSVRELFPSLCSNIFSQQNTIDSSTLALSSGLHIRAFNILDIDSFDINFFKKQQYSVENVGRVGTDGTIAYTEYLDAAGNNPTSAIPLLTQRTHIIAPFIVDPAIDFTINDSAKLIGVPFAYTNADLFIRDPGVYAQPPIIEQIIRDRFVLGDPILGAGSAAADALNNAAAFLEVEVKRDYNQAKANQESKYLSIINAMVKKLVLAQQVIGEVMSRYYWTPSPSVFGPENGCAPIDVGFSEKLTKRFVTELDADIIVASINDILNQVTGSITNPVDKTQSAVDVGGFNKTVVNSNFGPKISSAMGDVNDKALKSLLKLREKDFNDASSSLRTIEIIMGEFSGFGLCDIIAIMSALYTMPLNSLLGFLDSDAIKRAQLALSDQSLEGKNPGIQAAMDDLMKYVTKYYNDIDKSYQAAYYHNNSA